MSKFKDYLTLRYLIIGIPKYFSRLRIIFSVIYIFFYFFFSIYKISLNETGNLIYIAILLLTISASIFLTIYYLINRSICQGKHYKNTQSYLSILVNALKLLLLGSNIIVLISLDSTATVFDILALVFSSLYLIYIVLIALVNILFIIGRIINFKKYISLLRNKDLVNYVANDIRESIKAQNHT